MDELRCPSCASRVTADADWCTLCYARLGVDPVAAAAITPPDFAAAGANAWRGTPAPYDPLTAALSELAADPDAPAERGAVATAAPSPTWPCSTCKADVAIALDACPTCGAQFLAGGGAELELPFVGRASQLNGRKKMWIMIGGSLAIMAVFFVGALLIGLFV